MLVVAAENNQECWQLDITTVSLNADFVKDVYVKTPPGFEELDGQVHTDVVITFKSHQGRRHATLSPFRVAPSTSSRPGMN